MCPLFSLAIRKISAQIRIRFASWLEIDRYEFPSSFKIRKISIINVVSKGSWKSWLFFISTYSLQILIKIKWKIKLFSHPLNSRRARQWRRKLALWAILNVLPYARMACAKFSRFVAHLSPFLEGILMEHVVWKDSFISDLSFDTTCSIRFPSQIRVIKDSIKSHFSPRPVPHWAGKRNQAKRAQNVRPFEINFAYLSRAVQVKL